MVPAAPRIEVRTATGRAEPSDAALGALATAAAASGFRGGGRMATMDGPTEALEFCVQVIKMEGSVVVWVGPAKAELKRFDNLAAAMPSMSARRQNGDGIGENKSHDRSSPCSSTSIFSNGGMGEGVGCAEDMAARLSKRFGFVVYVSYNLPAPAIMEDAGVALAVEKTTGDLLKSFADDAQAQRNDS